MRKNKDLTYYYPVQLKYSDNFVLNIKNNVYLPRFILNKNHPIHNEKHITTFLSYTSYGISFYSRHSYKSSKIRISSVVSIIEDQMIEQMRAVICKNEDLPYIEIKKDEEDYRARRITAYLNVLDIVLQKQMVQLKKEKFDEDQMINQYFEMLPDYSSSKALYKKMLISEEMIV